MQIDTLHITKTLGGKTADAIVLLAARGLELSIADLQRLAKAPEQDSINAHAE